MSGMITRARRRHQRRCRRRTPPFGPNVIDRDTARVVTRFTPPPKPKVVTKKKPKVTG